MCVLRTRNGWLRALWLFLGPWWRHVNLFTCSGKDNARHGQQQQQLLFTGSNPQLLAPQATVGCAHITDLQHIRTSAGQSTRSNVHARSALPPHHAQGLLSDAVPFESLAKNFWACDRICTAVFVPTCSASETEEEFTSDASCKPTALSRRHRQPRTFNLAPLPAIKLERFNEFCVLCCVLRTHEGRRAQHFMRACMLRCLGT